MMRRMKKDEETARKRGRCCHRFEINLFHFANAQERNGERETKVVNKSFIRFPQTIFYFQYFGFIRIKISNHSAI